MVEDFLKISRKKIPYPIREPLRKYLRQYARERTLPISYSELLDYQESVPLIDPTGKDTLWETAIYPAYACDRIHQGLKKIYAMLKAGGDFKVQEHLFIDRIDYCSFGNTHPFRIKIVNRYNEVYDYFYLKVADASRIYGLELEHLLSPNQLNFLTHDNTLVEEHIAGIPGDVFAAQYLSRPEFNPKRIAKDFVKFNERCLAGLLGDMRAYNFVFVITPDFDDYQFRIRPIDFDQQFYEGNVRMYQPQFFKENNSFVQLALQHFNTQVMQQYQQEERALIVQRMRSERVRLAGLRDALRKDDVAPPEKLEELKNSLAAHYQDPRFLRCACTVDIIELSLKRLIIRRRAA
ncbi:MAG: hypothetical protein JST06_11225 [Bacteroidetes bacterium]|nr:hypothetical protein [Bacteroidota bacterium]MBS1629604.1 hypothetical protein [Bacteroidota bacterium]